MSVILLSEIKDEEQFLAAQRRLEQLDLSSAKGEEMDGEDEEYEALAKLMSESPFKFDMDSGRVIKA